MILIFNNFSSKLVLFLFQTVYDSAVAVPHANIAAVTVSAIFVLVMVINNEVLKVRVISLLQQIKILIYNLSSHG